MGNHISSKGIAQQTQYETDCIILYELTVLERDTAHPSETESPTAGNAILHDSWSNAF